MWAECFFCGRLGETERHHIFGGALRKKSERYGLVVDLCHACHNEPPDGVHYNPETMEYLHQVGQQMAMEQQGWNIEDFRREFYKNYLEVSRIEQREFDGQADG